MQSSIQTALMFMLSAFCLCPRFLHRTHLHKHTHTFRNTTTPALQKMTDLLHEVMCQICKKILQGQLDIVMQNDKWLNTYSVRPYFRAIQTQSFCSYGYHFSHFAKHFFLKCNFHFRVFENKMQGMSITWMFSIIWDSPE